MLRKTTLLTLGLMTSLSFAALAQNEPVIVQAESGAIPPADPPIFENITESGVQFLRVQADFAATQNPGTASRVISYTVTFPAAGTYELYARLRVGPGNFNDDSFYQATSFGTKSATNNSDWALANGLASGGFTALTAYVEGNGTAGNNTWKWVRLSDFTGVRLTVPAGNLTQTFQIGSRENGLDFDKLAFGPVGVRYTVANLDNGQPGTTNPPPPPFTPTGPPIATGKPKTLGGVYSTPQIPNFTAYWNQVVPENAGKWGSVEATRDVMNWTELDAAYKLAKDNGYPFRFHVLVWGNQQPSWIENLPPAEQLEEIKEWFAAVAQRYPAIDFLEVVNEPTNDPPSQPGSGGGNYINALGGNGSTGWDWILTSFRLAREYFPKTTKLMLNDYNVETNNANSQRYLTIVNLLRAENLIDAIGMQGHAFSTRFASADALRANLNVFAATGLPIYITEFDIDGATDEIQLQEYQRVFPIFWEHPAVKGVTLWGYRPGHWRTAQGAFIAYENGAERPALVWLRNYVQNASLLAITSFNCKYTGSVLSGVDFVVGNKDGSYTPGVPPLFINGVTANGQLGTPYTYSFDANQSTLAIQDQATRTTYAVWDFRQACATGPTPTPSGTFAITAVTGVSCTTVTPYQRIVTFTPQYSGLNGQAITFSVVNETLPTTEPGPYTLTLYTDNPTVTLRAEQAGTAGATTYPFNWVAACPSANARRGAAEQELPLSLSILGNPTLSETVQVDVRGAAGQSVRLQSLNSQGQPLSEVTIHAATSSERATLKLGQSAGMYFLKATTSTQQQVIKVMKQ
ncbi:endo-1,4-beta-xylanase [Fibrisoma limi BUZ 3]|uniref:Beta-xylanase n=1 Tax=Fibrisoma limi BUZ 3 TaxID=1185876 RepID=I2GLV6_9BACT|nr:endo-1,4-beta-xylanase [Fibrisoma limi]CCH54882.1 endo-1,4-beta-xylanase [Fibrisoma limi BUZ 3]